MCVQEQCPVNLQQAFKVEMNTCFTTCTYHKATTQSDPIYTNRSGRSPVPATGKTAMMERRKVMTMPPMVVPGQRQARQMARQEIVRQMELGATVAEAQRRCSVAPSSICRTISCLA